MPRRRPSMGWGNGNQGKAGDHEHETWRDALDAETGEGKQIDPSMGGDRDALNVYLIPTSAVEGEDEEAD